MRRVEILLNCDGIGRGGGGGGVGRLFALSFAVHALSFDI